MLSFFTVLSRIYALIGCFAKDYPDTIETNTDDGVKIRNMYLKALEKAVIEQHDVIYFFFFKLIDSIQFIIIY